MRSSPSRPIDRTAWLAERPFAHRGLHGAGRPENGLSAFRAAAAAGHGIELDVRLSKDGVAVVFHDSTLDRLTGEVGAVADRNSGELSQLRLLGSDDTVPTLADVIAELPETPLLIELKADGRRVRPLCAAVLAALGGRTARVAAMSFNPSVPRWFARHAPAVVRGLVVSEAGRRSIARHLSLWWGRPDFLAYDLRDLPSRFAARQRARGLPILTWTCRSDADKARAAAHADQLIYETAA
jgi:glycerophosphoryl diester phosphodiesterase